MTPRPRWTEDQVWRWWNSQPSIVGANLTPSTACNQLGLWQADTFTT